MGKIKVTPCDIKGLYVIEPSVFPDSRGYFMETYNQNDFKEAGLNMVFVQDNLSMSAKGTLRGMHFQKNYQQGKLVCVVSGEVFDAVVDIRDGSRTYGQWFGTVLSAVKKNMLYVPEGFAHGFLVLSDTAVFSYKLSDYYHPEDESGIPWNDETIGIRWPIPKDMTILTSERDSRHPAFGEGSALKPKKNRKTMEATVHANVMDETSRGRI